jgi:hydroxyacylglutathione hydrolase
MNISILNPYVFSFLIILQYQCAPTNNFVLHHQVTGPIKTNCYLLYDIESKEAALFDVGGPVDSLISIIKEKQLILKFIFATHAHIDHLEGVPVIRERFPNALLCYTKEDYNNFLVSIDWSVKHFDPKLTEAMKQDSATAKWFDYDLSIFGPPDINVEDNHIFKLGDLEIKTILSPGHSVGSICYQVGNVLFSGDVLSNRSVGRTDLLGGSKEALVRSVRVLYTLCPDETKVYPGHRQPTDIGSEKKENKKITINEVNLK